ncbi:MAG: hypothetical protein V2B20_23090 [Pseudomonadota bacterium]
MCLKKESNQLNLTLNPDLPEKANEQAKLVLDLLKILCDHYRNDINAVWQRSQFFVTAHGAMIALIASAKLDTKVIHLISQLGIALAVIWFVLAAVTARWIRVWREMVIRVESEVFVKGPFHSGEPGNGWYHIVRPQHISWIVAMLFFGFWIHVLYFGAPWAR